MDIAAGTSSGPWPALPLDAWRDTYATLHMWTQVVGKVCLALTPPVNHYWNIAFRVTARGLAAPPIAHGSRAYNLAFDFVDHVLDLRCSDGSVRQVRLESRSVADFYRETIASLRQMGLDVRIWTMPVEVPDPIRFENDAVHHTYDPAWAHAFWQALLSVAPVLERFRAGFVGKSSPVHFFWGSFDLAVTRFSGRRAPDRPGADRITREAYSHEVISHGFWPGSGPVQEAAFYAYAAPEPDGFKRAGVTPAGAGYNTELSEFILPYDVVRTSGSPEKTLWQFLETTYEAAASLAGWDRGELERK